MDDRIVEINDQGQENIEASWCCNLGWCLCCKTTQPESQRLFIQQENNEDEDSEQTQEKQVLEGKNRRCCEPAGTLLGEIAQELQHLLFSILFKQESKISSNDRQCSLPLL